MTEQTMDQTTPHRPQETDNRLLTEKQRQQKYLDRLPSDFTFPLFNARRALESQRSSGYRTTAAASREIVDNSIEARATEVHVIFERSLMDGKQTVTSVAFIDNGPGMLPKMARFALSWGGGTHYDDPTFIGKFGFGLPNASINQTTKTEVYTRMFGDEQFTKATLDIDTFTEYGSQSVPETTFGELPLFVQRYIDEKKLDLSHGTVVVWVNPDRLSFKKTQTLKEHLVDDFGVVYRYLLVDPNRPVKLVVEHTELKPVDPLFLMPEGRYYLPQEQGGAIAVEEKFIPVKYYRDSIGERHLVQITELSEVDPADTSILASGVLQIRISRFPVGFAVGKKVKRDKKEDIHFRFDIRKPRRGMSFVRAGREIETVDLFPKTDKEDSKDLGEWPSLQTYAYHWAVETKFPSDLDMVMGVTNDKQGVRPIEDFWRVLNQAGIASSLQRENAWQVDNRDRTVPQVEPLKDTPSPAESAAKDAESAGGTGLPDVPDGQKPAAVKGLDEEVAKRASITDKTVDEVRKALEVEARRRPYRIEYYSSEDGPFYKPVWVGAQIVVRVNQSHPFFQVLYGDLLRLPGGDRAKEAVDLLLITLSRAELTHDEETRLWYEAQRKNRWSMFLDTAMSSLRQRYQTPEDLVDSMPDLNTENTSVTANAAETELTLA